MNEILYLIFFTLGLVVRIKVQININSNGEPKTSNTVFKRGKKDMNTNEDNTMVTFLENINNYSGDGTGQKDIDQR